MKKSLFLCVFLGLTGCWTMHFTKKNYQPTGYSYSQWHHIGLLGLMEFSDPVNLKSTCGGEDNWQAVRVQTGFLQGLVKFISIPVGGSQTVGNIEVPRTVSVGSFYSPEEVSISCKK